MTNAKRLAEFLRERRDRIVRTEEVCYRSWDDTNGYGPATGTLYRPTGRYAVRSFTGPHSQRVRVTDRGHPMFGATGTTARLRMCDNGAWVAMDMDPPPELRSFPLDDARGRHVLLYPDQCERAAPQGDTP